MAQNEFADFEIQQSFEEVASWNGEARPLVPVGDYTLRVAHIEQKPSSAQQPMISVTFEVMDEGEHLGAKVWNNYSLQPQALGRLKAFMVACGASLDKFRASECYGVTIRGSVVHTDGKPGVDQQGNPLPAKTFANVWNEQPLEEVVAAPAPTPPIIKGKAGSNGQARRA